MKRFLCILFILAVQALPAANIGLLVMATGRYIEFIPNLVQSVEMHFCKGHQVTVFVFTDKPMEDMQNTVRIQQERLGWPYDTLKRYHVYLANHPLLESQDYLFACDADMLFVGDVGDEILSERVATIHPGFYDKDRTFYSYETNLRSLAFVKLTEGTYYFCGGFYGGTAQEFLTICSTNATNIDKDFSRGIIAEWHDESHWNRYCIDHPPTVILSPSYCYAESWELPFEKKLIALDKNHSDYQTSK